MIYKVAIDATKALKALNKLGIKKRGNNEKVTRIFAIVEFYYYPIGWVYNL